MPRRALIASWLVLWPAFAAAQAPRRVSTTPALECAVSLVEELALGSGSAAAEDGFSAIIAYTVDGSGRIYIADNVRTRVTVFDRSGHFIRRIGAAGRGRGEFQVPYRLAVRDSEVFVFDRGVGRIVVFDTTGRPLRDGLLPFESYAQPSMTPLSGGGLLFSGSDGAGRVIHELDASFREVRAFGEPVRSGDTTAASLLGSGEAVLTAPDTIWYAPVAASEIRQYARDGTLRLIVDRINPFRYDPRPLVTRRQRGTHLLVTTDVQRALSIRLAVDSRGRLWHFVRDVPSGQVVVDVFDSPGNYLRRYVFPAAAAPGRLAPDGRLYGISMRKGFPQVVRYGTSTANEGGQACVDF